METGSVAGGDSLLAAIEAGDPQGADLGAGCVRGDLTVVEDERGDDTSRSAAPEVERRADAVNCHHPRLRAILGHRLRELLVSSLGLTVPLCGGMVG